MNKNKHVTDKLKLNQNKCEVWENSRFYGTPNSQKYELNIILKLIN